MKRCLRNISHLDLQLAVFFFLVFCFSKSRRCGRWRKIVRISGLHSIWYNTTGGEMTVHHRMRWTWFETQLSHFSYFFSCIIIVSSWKTEEEQVIRIFKNCSDSNHVSLVQGLFFFGFRSRAYLGVNHGRKRYLQFKSCSSQARPYSPPQTNSK